MEVISQVHTDTVQPESVFSEVDEHVNRLMADLDRNEAILDAQAGLALALDRASVAQLSASLQSIKALHSLTADMPALHMSGRGKAYDNHLSSLLKAAEFAIGQADILDAQLRTILDRTAHPDVIRSSRLLMQLLEPLVGKVEALRWEVLELQADSDIASGRVKTFKNADSIVAFLHGSVR